MSERRDSRLVAASLAGLVVFVVLGAVAAWVLQSGPARDEFRDMAVVRASLRVEDYRARSGGVPVDALTVLGRDMPPNPLGILAYRPLDGDHFAVQVFYESAGHPTPEHPFVPRWAHPAGLVWLSFDARPFEGPIEGGLHLPYAIGRSPVPTAPQRR